MEPTLINKQLLFLSYPGEMADYVRRKDWTKTSLGSPESWPTSLQTMLGVILHSKFPMFIFWGPELICFYNDAYRPSLGKEGKHPHILGMPGEQAWPEIWHIIHPLIHQVLAGGEATWNQDQLIPMYRDGKIDDVYWTFSYSRINNDENEPYGVFVTCVETTSAVINQRQLQESKNLLEFATEAAELGTWDYNPKTGNFASNQRLKNWMGLATADETDLKVALEIVADYDRQRVIDSMDATLDYARQAPFDIEFVIVPPHTKKEMVVLVKGRPFFDEHGVAYRFSGTMEEITEKVKVRKVLAENEKNLRNLVEQAPVAMCVLKGPNHIVEIVNEKMVDLWGKNYSDVLGRPMADALPELHGQGLEELLNQVYQTGERCTAQEMPVELPRGTKMAVVYQNFVYEPLIGATGVIEGVIAVTIDVTEQVLARRKVEEAEERARLATEGANLGTFDFDLIRGTTVVSPRYLEIFDVDAHTSHADKIKRIHPEDLPIRNRAHDEALLTGRLFYEVRIVRSDGQITWVHIEGKVIKDKTGNSARIVGTALDITDKKLYEKQREEYIAIASHELRNPLTSLKLALDLMSENLPRPEQAELLEKCRNQVKRLISMTGELLNVSKISAGVLDLKPEIINIKHSIEDSIITAQAGIHTNDITITGSPDINVRADKFRIEQVLVNLLNNASKYSPEHSPIVVNVTTIASEVKVTVIDKGIGIDANKIGAMFKKFSRVDSGGIEGYGLGLYISDQIIRKHGGQMGVESEKGIGSAFWFTLPR